MQNKTKPWLNVQIVVTTFAMTISLALWNIFASSNHPTSSAAAPKTQTTGGSQVIDISPPAVSQSPLRIFLGGAAPQALSQPAAPAPLTITGSSRP
jgi:hypothetical protein